MALNESQVRVLVCASGCNRIRIRIRQSTYPALQVAHALRALLELLLQRARRLRLLRALGTQLALHLLRRLVRARQLCSMLRAVTHHTALQYEY